MSGSCYLRGKPIKPKEITGGISAAQLIEETFLAYNAGRLREACRLFTRKMLEPDVTVGLSITGALTPAGMGMSSLIPLIDSGFIDWIVSTGANLYHDTHFALGLTLHPGSPHLDDRKLRQEGVIRIYDILFDYNVLLSTDAFYSNVLRGEEFNGEMSTAELHYKIGRYVNELETTLAIGKVSVLAAAYRAAVPIYTSSPGDSSIGMNIARLVMDGSRLRLDVARDVNETAAIVLHAKEKGKSAVFMLGGGSPKNFVLQTEPHIQEILGIKEAGHDYYLQITDARPDTGGLSGATPGEAVTWGKVDAEQLPDAVVCYADTTIALPLLTAYAVANRTPRPLSRLYNRIGDFSKRLSEKYSEAKTRG
ncbi:MAG TPA: deoxyhypusine synthase [Thermodesulfovibrionales bacterium]|nr:deoxyhypusine synthase [Thermodesulfovibrionales bacterium]